MQLPPQILFQRLAPHMAGQLQQMAAPQEIDAPPGMTIEVVCISFHDHSRLIWFPLLGHRIFRAWELCVGSTSPRCSGCTADPQHRCDKRHRAHTAHSDRLLERRNAHAHRSARV
jgi:hypothetical protein